MHLQPGSILARTNLENGPSIVKDVKVSGGSFCRHIKNSSTVSTAQMSEDSNFIARGKSFQQFKKILPAELAFRYAHYTVYVEKHLSSRLRYQCHDQSRFQSSSSRCICVRLLQPGLGLLGGSADSSWKCWVSLSIWRSTSVSITLG